MLVFPKIEGDGTVCFAFTQTGYAFVGEILSYLGALLQLEKKEKDKVMAGLSFNVDNVGDRSTTLVRVNAILGDHVEVLEGLRDVPSHSSIRYPEKTDSAIKLFTRYGKIETLNIVVIYSHGSCEKTYKLPQISEWDKHALWKGGPLVLLP